MLVMQSNLILYSFIRWQGVASQRGNRGPCRPID